MRSIVLVGSLLAGCPDPSTAEGLSTPVAAETPPPPPPNSEETSPGFSVAAGEGVQLSGTVSYAGSKVGKYHIDFLQPPESGHFPKLVHSLLVDEPGAWSIEAPKKLGKVGVIGYLDVAGDGPSDGDPAFRFPGLIDVDELPLANLDLVLSDSPDLGEFTPGLAGPPQGPPADGASSPPSGAAEGAAPASAPPAEATSAAPPPEASTVSTATTPPG